MQTKQQSLLDRGFDRLLRLMGENRVPLLSVLIAGLLAHMYVITNNLPTEDGIRYLFGKGETVGSGRWGLALLQYVIPNYTMPWLHGITSILLMAAAICLIVRLFEIKTPLSQALLSALIICFPSQIGNFCFIFVSSCYAVSFLLAVLSVWLIRTKRGWRRWLYLPCLIFALSIYQGYVALASSLLLLLVMKDIFDAGAEDRSGPILKTGLLYVLLLAVAAGIYRVSINAALAIAGIDPNEYTNEALYMGPGLLKGIATAYRMFLFNLTSRYNMLIVSKLSRALHFLAFLAAGAGIVSGWLRYKNPRHGALLLLCLILLPLSLCCLYIIIQWGRIHALVLYGFVSLYVLVFLSLDQLPQRVKNAGRDIACAALTLVVVINTCYANRTYLKIQLQYENAYSLATTLMTQIRSLPGYDEHYKLSFYYSAGDYIQDIPQLTENDTDLFGAGGYLLAYSPYCGENGETEPNFFRYFLGSTAPFASRQETEALARDPRTRDMPVYPDAGSIRIIDDYIYVKFSEGATH